MLQSLKLFIGLGFAALTAIGADAQDAKAKEILDEISNRTRQYSTITSDFSFQLEDKIGGVNQTQAGSLKMKGKKYQIVIGANTIYSDGTTRWTYNKDLNEVYIDQANLGGDDLNPSEIYTVWETGFKSYYEKEMSVGGKNLHVIKLVPVKPADKTYHTVRVYIDKEKMEVAKIEILGKQGDNYTYTVKTFQPNQTYAENIFVFDKTKHSGVEIIDNR